MNIITRLFNQVSKGATPFLPSLGGKYGLNLGGNGIVAVKGLEEYKNWVYACVKVRSNAVANIDLQLVDVNGEVIERNEITEVLDKVNPYMTRKELLKATQAFLDLNGNAFWFLARTGENGEGDVKEIYILRPDRVTIVTDKANPLVVTGYVFKQDGSRKVPLNVKEVLHFKNFNPNADWPFPHLGIGVIEASQWAIATDNEIRKWNLKFFQNSALPDGILEVGGDSAMSADEYQRLRAEWDVEHKGSVNAHKTAILSGGLTWKETARSQTEMQFADQKILNRDEILAIFQVPKTILGLTDGINRATAEASIYVFNLFVVKEQMQNIVDTLNEFLIPEFATAEKYHFTFTSPAKEDRIEVLAEYTQGMDRWLTRNEIRAREGLPPTENGDTIMGTFNQVPIDNTTKPKKGKANAKPVAKVDTSNMSIAEKAVEEFVGKMPTKKIYKHVGGITKENYIQVWKAGLQSNTGELKKKLYTYFEKQEAQVQRNLRNELKGLSNKEFKLKAVTDVVFDEEDAIKAGISLITPFLKDYLKRAGEQATILAGGDTFDSESPTVSKFIKVRAEYFSKTVNETTATRIVEVVQQGIDNEDDLDTISESIAEVYNIAKGSRTDMIARTEASASANEGAKIAYKDSGVEQWEWVVVDPLDEDCKQNEGEVVKIGEAFKDGSTQPPDPHPNCECATLPVFEDNN